MTTLKRTTRIARMTAKQKAKREANGERYLTSTVSRSSLSKRKASPRNWLKAAGNRKRKAERKAERFARCFHSEDRVTFVKSLPCCVTGARATAFDPIDNAHVITDGSEGTSRRGGFSCIAPLKRSVHRMLHDQPEKFRRLYPFADEAWFTEAAALTEKLWQRAAGLRGADE